MSVDGVSLPVYQVDLLHTTQHDLGRNTFSLRQEVDPHSILEYLSLSIPPTLLHQSTAGTAEAGPR